jgi:Flagellar biosynthesis protein, FliO
MDVLSRYLPTVIGILVVTVLAIIGLMVYRALNKRIRGRRGSRLAISEYHEVDQTRRLVLVRRDGVEHLLLIGGGQDIVVESGIGGARAPAERPSPIPMRTAPRPTVFPEERPSLRSVPRGEPSFTSPRGYDDPNS